MHPILFTIFGKDIHFYQVFYPLTMLIGILLVTRRAKREGIPEEIALGTFVFVLLGILFGSRLIDVIVHLDYYLKHPARIFNIRRGIVLYGGFIGAILGAMGYLRYKRRPALPMIDIAMTYFGFGLAIHRSLACFMAGCCFGKPTDLPWGVVFPVGSLPYKVWGSVPLHPSQLYEAAAGLVIFAILLVYRLRKRRVHGELFALGLILYGTARFLLEFMRGDNADRGFFGPLSTSQWISLGFFIIAAALFARARGIKKQVADGKRDAKTAFAVCAPGF